MSAPQSLEHPGVPLGGDDAGHTVTGMRPNRPGLAQRLTWLRKQRLARHALRRAGKPDLVLDLSCAEGAFWPLLCEEPNRVLLAGGNTAARLEQLIAAQPRALHTRIRPLVTSPFAIDLGENAVDCIFSMQLVSHRHSTPERLALLTEFQRVTRDTLILSLRVAGSDGAWREKQALANSKKQPLKPSLPVIVPRRTLEAEFEQTGFDILSARSLLPGGASWRIYTLRKHDA